MGVLRILVAYPGLGKTTLAQSDPRFIDLDYGTFRDERLSKSPDTPRLIPYQFCQKILDTYKSSRDAVILTNFLPRVSFLVVYSTIHMDVPPSYIHVVSAYPDETFEDVWFRTLEVRDKGSEFLQQLRANRFDWKSQWISHSEEMSRILNITYPERARLDIVRPTSYLSSDEALAYFSSSQMAEEF